MNRIIVPISPFPSDNQGFYFEMEVKGNLTLKQAVDEINKTSFKLEKNHWVFVESDTGALGQRAEFIEEELQ